MAEFIVKGTGWLLVFFIFSAIMGSLVWPMVKEIIRLSLVLLGLY